MTDATFHDGAEAAFEVAVDLGRELISMFMTEHDKDVIRTYQDAIRQAADRAQSVAADGSKSQVLQ